MPEITSDNRNRHGDLINYGSNSGGVYPTFEANEKPSPPPGSQTNPLSLPSGSRYTGGGFAGGPPGLVGENNRRGGLWRSIGIPFVAGIVGALLVLMLFPWAFGVNPFDIISGRLSRGSSGSQRVETHQTVKVISPAGGAMSVAEIAKKITPSIVHIDTKRVQSSIFGFELGIQEGTGSGVIYDSNGYILTNHHVVGDATEIKVTLASGEELDGRKIGSDRDNDIAVVKVERSNLPALEIGDSDSLVVGELAVAVGSPFGFEQSVTSGIISALHRNVSVTVGTGDVIVLTDLIQTDAAINPGNSGGALCDSNAKLIGINTLIASQSGGSEGVGFAIPIKTAKRIADDIIAGRPVSHPYMGITGQSVSEEIAKRYELPTKSGAYVTSVFPGGPADKAGIKQGDIIVGIDGRQIKSMDDLIAEIRRRNVGDTMMVEFYSGRERKSVRIKLEEKPRTID